MGYRTGSGVVSIPSKLEFRQVVPDTEFTKEIVLALPDSSVKIEDIRLTCVPEGIVNARIDKVRGRMAEGKVFMFVEAKSEAEEIIGEVSVFMGSAETRTCVIAIRGIVERK